MKTQVRMIALDMDGTVLNDQKEITSYTKAVLERAIEKGVIVLACTGRPTRAIPKAFMEIKGIRYAISSNGAFVIDVENDKVLFEKLIAKQNVLDLLELAGKYDTYREVFSSGKGYTSKILFENIENYHAEYMCSYIAQTRGFLDDLEAFVIEREMPCEKVQMAFADREERLNARREIKQMGDYEIESALEMSLEITAPGVNKGTGILKLADYLGIKPEEVMAIGDGMNDASMLQVVGVPVVMENGVSEIKEMASYITVNNNEDGVAKAIEKLVLCD